DRLVKEKLRVRHYTRYMDDLVLLHPDKAFLRQCLGAMRKLLQEGLRLEFNEKTQISPIRSGVEYLGFRFSLTGTGKVIRRLKTGTKMRFKHKLKRMSEEYRAGVLSWEDIKQVLCSYHGYFAKGHCWHMHGKALGSFVLTKGAPQAEDKDYSNMGTDKLSPQLPILFTLSC
ncbi:MAG: RNA-directed DNA polymerase, partial [Desulfobulbus sp.]|nr:RNA-directed DNA polymerase [Desulfobulbus sp.]